ncbi:hypothetical protein [Dankookia sp. P2]|uniref:hypothetical protein n=1 Tax=Dankookia sp. P2 TaxID=3423955 RepID=UPI003D671584
MRLETKLAAIEQRLRPSTLQPWETVLVDQTAGETRAGAMVRHFGSNGAPPNARLIIVTIGDAKA